MLIRWAEPSSAAVWDKAMGGAELTPEECMQFLFIAMAEFRTAEESYAQHKDSLLSQTAFETVSRWMRLLLSAPRFRAVWPRFRQAFDSDFVTWVDDLLNTTQPLDSKPFIMELRSALAEAAR
jgi:hypothetical protein